MTQALPTTVLDMESGDDTADECQETITTGDRAGEVCGRDRPCPHHD